MLIVLGVAFLGTGMLFGRRYRTTLDRGERVRARVLELIEKVSRDSDGTSRTFRAVLEVVDGPRAGIRQTEDVGSNPPLHRRGEIVDTLYDPVADRLVSMKGMRSSKWLAAAFLIAGGGTIIWGLLD